MLENHEIVSNGPADFQEGKTHHNWYLFEDKIDSASSEFKIIEVDELCQKNIGTKSGGIGKLYVEEELVVGIEPVLFVCIDDKNNRYLVMTYDSYNGIYIYRKIESDELLDMLENRNTMERTFRLGKRIYKTFIEENSNILGVEEYDSQTFSGSMLPDVGEYYEIHSEYIQKYIEKLRGCKINQR